MTNINKELAGNLHRLAQQAFEKGDSQSARSLWTAALAQDPGHTDCYVSLAKLESADGNDAAAIHLLSTAVKQDPANFTAALKLAEVINRQSKRAPAEQAATAKASAVPEVPASAREAADAFQAPKASARAEAPREASPPKTPEVSEPSEAASAGSGDAASASEPEPEAVPVHHSTPYGDDDEVRAQRHFDRGKQLIDRKNIPSAINAFKQAIDVDGSNPKYHYKLASVYHVHSKNLSAAKPSYEKARDLDPTNPMWHNGLGVCQEELGELKEALHSVSYALELRPDNAIYKDNTARLKTKVAAAEHKEAEAARRKEADSARRRESEAPKAGPSRGSERAQSAGANRAGHAEGHAPAAETSDPLAPQAGDTPRRAERRRNLDAGYRREAARRDTLLAANPFDATLVMETAQFHYVFGRWDQARTLMARSRDISPPSAASVGQTVEALKVNTPANNLAHGTKMARHLDVEDALPYFMAAAQQRPESPAYQSMLGLAFLGMGMVDDALIPLRKAVELGGAGENARADAFNLAVALEQAGRPSDAAGYRSRAGVDVGVRLSGAELLRACLSNNRAGVPVRSSIPGDGLVEGQGLESLEILLQQMSGAGAVPRQQQARQEAPRPQPQQQQRARQEAPRPSPGAAPQAPAHKFGGSKPAGTGRFPELSAHLSDGPSYTAQHMGPVTAREPKAANIVLNGKPALADFGAHGLTADHVESIRTWLQAESVRKRAWTTKKVLVQAAPMVLAGGVAIGGAAYKYLRLSLEQTRLEDMTHALNREYASKGVQFSIKQGYMFVFRRQEPRLTIRAQGRG